MPELPVKEVRLAELHLPELKRDEIVRTLSEIRPPTIDLPALERPAEQVRERLARIDWQRLDPTTIDLGRTAAGVAAIARLGRPIVRSRWMLAIGTLAVIGVAGAALLSRNTTVRERAGRTVDGVRARIEARGGGDLTARPDADPADGSGAPAVETETLGAMVESDAAEAPTEAVSPA